MSPLLTELRDPSISESYFGDLLRELRLSFCECIAPAVQYIHGRNVCLSGIQQIHMQEQPQQEMKMEGKIKAQIIKQIFKDLGPKNLKGVECFYLIVKQEQLEFQFTSNAKDIFITIVLKNTLFQHYRYNRQRPSLHKYALDDLIGIAYLFENNKILLDLNLTYEELTFTASIGKGYAQFTVTPLNCDQDDEDFLINEEDLRPRESSSMELRLAKVGLFEGILSYAKGCKLNSLWFRFDSVRKMLEVTDKAEAHEIKWLLKLEDSRLYNFDKHLQFHSRALACALNLLPNDSELILTFYSTFMLLDVPEKEKSFTIRLNAKNQENPGPL